MSSRCNRDFAILASSPRRTQSSKEPAYVLLQEPAAIVVEGEGFLWGGLVRTITSAQSRTLTIACHDVA